MTGALQAGASTQDAFHRGRFLVVQPAAGGHRAGLDALVLAAAVPEGFAGRLADLGAGAGAAGLAVAARCPGARCVLVERDPTMAGFARLSLAHPGNAALAQRLEVLEADVTLRGAARREAGLADGGFDFAIMNPPFNAPGDRASPDRMRAAAHVMPAGSLQAWTRTAAAILRGGGGMALIARPESLADILAALAGRFGSVRIRPVLPRPGAAAIRVVVAARKGSRRRLELLAPLVLHGQEGSGFTQEAAAILDGGAGLFAD